MIAGSVHQHAKLRLCKSCAPSTAFAHMSMEFISLQVFEGSLEASS